MLDATGLLRGSAVTCDIVAKLSGCLVCVTASKKRQEGLNLSRQGAFIAEGGGH